MSSSFWKLTLRFAAWSIVVCPVALIAQSSPGTLLGKVSFADGKPAVGVIVVITNQTSADETRRRTGSDGTYSVRLRAGAYRIRIESPFEAQFDRGKLNEYGVFANVICDEAKKRCTTLENVIVESGERKIDIVVVDPSKETADASTPAAPALPDRREVRDRWRIEFPEYDRYGDRGARGRDVPFRRGK